MMGLLLMVIVFSFERFAVISKEAAGKGNLDKFMADIQRKVSKQVVLMEQLLLVINKKVRKLQIPD